MYSIDHGFENNNKRQIGTLEFPFINSIYKKFNNIEDQTSYIYIHLYTYVYIYIRMSYIVRNVKNKTKND